jgi:uncharacterized protein HemX
MAGAAVAGLGQSVYSGVQGQKQQKKALQEQKNAQQIAMEQTLSEQRKTAMDTAKANRRVPDVSAMLAAAQKPRKPSTLLSDSLGASSLLGDAGGM